MVKKSNIYSLEKKSYSNAYIELKFNTQKLDCMWASFHFFLRDWKELSTYWYMLINHTKFTHVNLKLTIARKIDCDQSNSKKLMRLPTHKEGSWLKRVFLKTGIVHVRRLLVIFRLNGKLNTVLCLMEVCVVKILIRRKILYMLHVSLLWGKQQRQKRAHNNNKT